MTRCEVWDVAANVRPMSSSLSVLAQPAIRRYLSSTALAAVGMNLVVTVLFKQVFDLTGNELYIAYLGLAQFVPAALLVLVSGWIADRYDRRVVTGVLLGGRGVAILGLALVSTNTLAVTPLVVLTIVIGACDAVLMPARRALPPLIASSTDFPRVVALWTATFTSSAIVGPVLGGFAYSWWGARNAYLVGAALHLTAIIPLVGLRYLRRQERLADRPTLHSALEGLRFVRRTPIVAGVITLDLFAVLFGGAVALIPAVATERLGVGDVAYGWLRAAPGVGAGAMAIWLAVRPVTRRVGPTLLAVVAIFGVGTVVFGLTRNYAVAFVALVVLSAADMVSMFIRGTIVPLVTPTEQLGRVTAVESVFIGASNELGAFESGVAARFLGLPLAIAGGGAITVVIAAATAVAFPALRRVDTFASLSPAEQRSHCR